MVSLFLSYKVGKVIENKNNALEESEDRTSVILDGNRYGSDAVSKYLDRVQNDIH